MKKKSHNKEKERGKKKKKSDFEKERTTSGSCVCQGKVVSPQTLLGRVNISENHMEKYKFSILKEASSL